MIPASIDPKNRDISTAERATAITPTPIRNARITPECLPDTPSIILAIPLIRNKIAINIIIVMAAATVKAEEVYYYFLVVLNYYSDLIINCIPSGSNINN
jgi:hypothetical protein